MSEQPNDDNYPYDDEELDTCFHCGGEGFYHDCGEDTCCCADPESQDVFICPECNGTGELR